MDMLASKARMLYYVRISGPNSANGLYERMMTLCFCYFLQCLVELTCLILPVAVYIAVYLTAGHTSTQVSKKTSQALNLGEMPFGPPRIVTQTWPGISRIDVKVDLGNRKQKL